MKRNERKLFNMACGTGYIARYPGAFLCLLFLPLLADSLLGQSAPATQATADAIPKFDSIAPRQVEREEKPVELPKPRKEEGDERVLIESLDGLYFTSNKDSVALEGRTDLKGIAIDGVDGMGNEAFPPLLEKYLNKEMSIATLKQIIRDVVEYYRSIDQPVIDIVVPEQEITTGVVQILVIEGKVGEIRAEGNRWFDSRVLVSKVRMEQGDKIYASKLIQDIQLLNVNPFREVDVAFTPGEEDGYTDVILKTQDRFPVRFYTGYDDTGNDVTGEERIIAGFNWGNALFQDHMLSYQFTTSPDLHTLNAHSMSYTLSFFRDDEFTVYGAYSSVSHVSVAPQVKPKNFQQSENHLTGYSYKIPLPSFDEAFTHHFLTRFDFRRSNSDVMLDRTPIREELTDTLQWGGGYSASYNDPFGSTWVQFEVIASPGGLTHYNRDENYEASRQFADADYTIYKLQGRRQIRLPWDFSFIATATMQKSDSNLLSNEQLNIGGYNTVRGYTENLLRGDEGYFFNLELRSPIMGLGKFYGDKKFNDGFQVLAFWDYGSVSNRRLLTGEVDDAQLSSVGLGVRYHVDRYFSLRADYGVQLLEDDDYRFNSRLHLGVILSY